MSHTSLCSVQARLALLKELDAERIKIEDELIKNGEDREVIRLGKIELDNSTTALAKRLQDNIREYNAL